MSPTVFRDGPFRFFFSREEERMHVHVAHPDGEAKFWLEPILSLADYHGLNQKKLSEIQKIIEGHRDEIVEAWQRHFGKH